MDKNSKAREAAEKLRQALAAASARDHAGWQSLKKARLPVWVDGVVILHR